MRLWDWAVEAHGWPDVDRLCLELQDGHGQCVSYLMWAAWAAIEGRAPDARALTRGASVARNWEAAVTGPLRAARRALKAPVDPVADAGREALRNNVKADEMTAERLLLEALETITPAERRAPRDPAPALADAARAWGGPPPTALFEALAHAFSKG